MKWLKAKYTYILIVLSLLLSAGLQVVWLQQLFDAQQKQLKDEIEHLVSRTAQTNMYYSLTIFKDPGNLLLAKQLFLSPQWEQLRMAFDNMKIQGMRTSTSIIVDSDSTAVVMSLNLKDSIPKNRKRPVVTSTGRTPAELRLIDSLSLVEMKKNVNTGLKKIGISSKAYYNIYSYNKTKVFRSDVPPGFKPVFTSRSYLYNIQDIYRCQLSLASINTVVWYRMRYYLASSILMVLLTCTAFYFIIRLLRSQELYAAAKADFTSNMTHELKTPIATVLVAMESIKKYNLINNPETLQSYLDISQHEMRRLDLMVEKALNSNSESESEQPLNLELYDVQSGLQQVINSMQLQLQNSSANIRFSLLEEPCFVYGDPVHLTNIFYNLIDNAFKYSGKDLLLEINCKYDAEKVTLSFKDNGPGIDKIYHKKIFERFFRVPEQGNIHNIKGSGLGLHYVKQIIEKHNGTIKVKSEPGHGTSFIITLPLAS
ncbi:signal transduction histidine kinase [Pedobacter cryoconitis]|uniref:histidine kinase n=1 Tax=Pedobacter cryoconitis TaxID=188932 RepID=A0A7W8ZPA4_9SPHI|nr:HAMP domain-containing sensor histidine kinase [Pedobacter cryoconitis]MBB5637698.1 signal transduction histidine kinase [Pedobacter cryoconitis]MBB6270545.1 signal transduction histidine kinase [Pedobacter cryoconitis]